MSNHTSTVDYRLPVTLARFTTATAETLVSYETSGAPNSLRAIDTTADVDFVTSGDERFALVAQVRNAWLYDVSATIKLTDDLRLSSAGSDSTGVVGQAFVAAVRIASTAAGLTAAGFEGGEATPGDPYLAAEPAAYNTINALRERVLDVDELIRDHFLSSLEDSSPAEVLAKMRIVRTLGSLRAGLEMELERSLRRRESWLSAHTTTRQFTSVEFIACDELPSSSVVAWDSDTGIATLNAAQLGVATTLWENARMVVTIDAVPSAPMASVGVYDAINNVSDREGVWIRIPRSVRWTVWRDAGDSDDGAPPRVVKVRSGSSLVVDNQCRYRFVKFRRSLWAKRSIATDFSTSGGLSSFASTSASTLAALATAANDSVTAASEGLTAAQGIRSSLSALNNGVADRKLADIIRQVETREQELKLAGVNATAADYAELERLKQSQAIVEAQAAVDPVALSIASLNRDTNLVVAQQDATQTIRDLRAELALEKLKNDLATLQG